MLKCIHEEENQASLSIEKYRSIYYHYRDIASGHHHLQSFFSLLTVPKVIDHPI